MADEDKENIDSQNDTSADDENTDSEDHGSGDSSDDTEDGKSQDDGSEGDGSDDDDGEDDKSPYTPREKRYYAQMKKAQGFKLVEGKWVKPQKSEPKPKTPPATETPDVNSAVQAALDKRDLDAMDLSDGIKTEIKNYAKLHGISVLAAAKSPYITFMKSEADKKSKSEEAAAGGKRKTQPITDFTNAKPEDFDLTTEQGRKDWEAYKKTLN